MKQVKARLKQNRRWAQMQEMKKMREKMRDGDRQREISIKNDDERKVRKYRERGKENRKRRHKKKTQIVQLTLKQ